MIIYRLRLFSCLLLAALAAIPARAQLGPVPLAGATVKPQGAAAARPLAQKLGDRLSLQDFGAACDGSTDDSAAIQAAAAAGVRVEIAGGLVCNGTSVSPFAAFGNIAGPGKVRDASGNLRGPQSAGVNAPPNPLSVGDNCSAGFGCWAKFDYSHTLSAEEFFINGAATLGQPAHGYQYMPGSTPHTLFFLNNSGWNQAHDSNDGRTGAPAYRIILQNSGGGDMGAFEAEILCGGHVGPGDANPGGYTSWLAVPACGYQGGDITAIAPHQYLQMQEWHFNDNGNDVAAIGSAMGYNRTSKTAPTLGNRWIDELSTCNLFPAAGAIPCDAQHMIQGQWRIGLDFAELATQIQAPIAMQANQKITLNSSDTLGAGNPATTNLGGDWLTDDGTGVVLAQNNATVLRLTNPAKAVNAWQLSGSVAGNALVFGPTGSDPQIPAILSDKAGGGVLIQSNNTIAMRVAAAGSNVNSYLNVAAGTTSSPLTLQTYGFGNLDLGLAAAGTGLVRLANAVPPGGDSSTAVATTAFVQATAKSAVGAMVANRYKILNVGSGATLPVPIPAAVIDQMIVEIQPNASTIATMTLTMPATSAVMDGFIVHFISTGTISSFTLAGNTGQTVVAGPSAINPATPCAYMWDQALAQWLPFR